MITNIDVIIIGCCDVLQGLARILSLGYWQSGWHIDYVGWKLRRHIKRLKDMEKGKV